MTIELPHHELDEDGDHDPEECQKCLELEHTVVCVCDCGDCCRSLIIETTLADAEREPLIAQRGQVLRDLDGVVGYCLNDEQNDYACTFFDHKTNRCTIWETRPGVCRLYNCDEQEIPKLEDFL